MKLGTLIFGSVSAMMTGLALLVGYDVNQGQLNSNFGLMIYIMVTGLITGLLFGRYTKEKE